VHVNKSPKVDFNLYHAAGERFAALHSDLMQRERRLKALEMRVGAPVNKPRSETHAHS
jgi:hypothetical protein